MTVSMSGHLELSVISAMEVSEAGGMLEPRALRLACTKILKAKEEYYFKQHSKGSHQLRSNVALEEDLFITDYNSIYRRSDSLL